MEENVNNNVLGDPDPNDLVRLAIISSNFDRALNSMYQPRSEVNGAALLDLLGKMLQINQSIDTDLTLHVQRVNLPRGNGCNRKLAVNMGLNILTKRCVSQPLNNMMTYPILVIPNVPYEPVDIGQHPQICLIPPPELQVNRCRCQVER